MSRVMQHSSDQSPSCSSRVQNGPQKLHTNSQQSPAAKPKPLSSKNANKMMEVREYDPESYAKDLHQCRLCSGKYTLSEFYQHYETEHRLCICVYCHNGFESRILLSVHLESEHKIPHQKYQNTETFHNNNGKQVDLMCIHCKEVFNSDSQLPETAKHQCGSKIRPCKYCKFPWPVGKLAEHESICQARISKMINTEVTLTPLRLRDGTCKKCLQIISPSKLAQHLKDCTGIPTQRSSSKQDLSQSQKNRLIKCGRCRTSFPVSKLQDHKQVCRPVAQSAMEQGQDNQQREEMIPLDPLLLEQDPMKRLNMLISLLMDYINAENKKNHAQLGDDSHPPVKVTLPEDFKDQPINWILQQLILRTAETCLYCRQAILIRVDKRQLVLHLFINHRFRIQIASDMHLPHKSIESSENKTEVAAVVQELVTKSALLANSSSEGQHDTAPAPTEPLNPIDQLLQCDPKQTESSTQETDQITQSAKTGHSEIENREIALINNSTPPAEFGHDFSWHEFEMLMLDQIFHSSDVLFCFDRGDVVFGRMSCDCLLCGQRIDSQLKLFAHWRVAHKGVAMRCAMCTGRFLFSGSLFSHHCFGTPKLFEEVRKAAILEARRAEDSGQFSQSSEQYADGESSNSTMVLRYQCEFCGIQLPGFFNYMVHVRKVHNTCELCLETVDNQKLLERHHRRHKLQHFCWKCGIPYLAKPNYMTHLFWKHGAESKQCYTCLEKKWSFIYHFCLPPATFVCDTCGIHFTKPVCLIVHKRLHSNEKLRKCTVKECLEKFISKKLLSKHIEATHKGAKAILGKMEGAEASQELKDLKLEDQQPQPVEDRPNVESIKEEVKDETPEVSVDQDQLKSEALNPDFESEPLEKVEEKTEPAKIPSLVLTIPSEGVGPSDDQGHSQPPEAEPMEGVNDAEETSTKQRTQKHKSRKDKSSFTSSLHGPNLSEEESDGDGEERDNETNQAENHDTTDSTHVTLPEAEPSEEPLHSPLIVKPETPAMSAPPGAVADDSKPVEDLQGNQNAVGTAMPTSNDQPIDNRAQSDETKTEAASLDASAGSMDTGDDFEKLDESQIDDFQAMSPLLPPLDNDFPDVPSLDDGAVNSQQHIVYCASLDHDYSLPAPKEDPKRKLNSPISQYDDSLRPPVKRLKISKVKSPKHKSKNMKRKRHDSSSSSSSSSSCSSCGSDCSCSSSSSSGDESHHRVPSPVKLKKIKIKKIKHSPVKKLKVVKDPTIPKRPVGRPPKYPKDGPRPPPPKPKTAAKQSAEQRMEKMLKHFRNKDDAYIPESDLETDLSDSEEKFDKQQIEEVIGKVPPAFNQAWKQTNEKFLLQVVKGVKNLEDLRPKPKPKLMNAQVHLVRAQIPPPAQRPLVKNNSYKVVTKPGTNGKQPRLKLRNVPLQKLYLVNTSARNGKPPHMPSFNPVASIRPPILKSDFSSHNSALNIRPQMRTQIRQPQQKSPIAGPSRSNMGGMGMQMHNNGRLALNKIHPNNMNFTGNQGLTIRPIGRETSFEANPISNASILARPSPPAPSAPTEVESQREEVPNPNVEAVNVVPMESATATVPAAESTPMVAEDKNGEDKPKNLYCYCQSDDGDSDMIACDGANCKHEWFHFRCVGVIVAPKGKWYCPDCRPKSKKHSRGSVENRPKPTRNGIGTTKGAAPASEAPSSDNMNTLDSKKNLSVANFSPLLHSNPPS